MKYILNSKRLENFLNLTAETITHLGVTEDLRLVPYSAYLFSMALREQHKRKLVGLGFPM